MHNHSNVNSICAQWGLFPESVSRIACWDYVGFLWLFWHNVYSSFIDSKKKMVLSLGQYFFKYLTHYALNIFIERLLVHAQTFTFLNYILPFSFCKTLPINFLWDILFGFVSELSLSPPLSPLHILCTVHWLHLMLLIINCNIGDLFILITRKNYFGSVLPPQVLIKCLHFDCFWILMNIFM